MYLAPQNIPRAISVLTLGNKVVLYIRAILGQRGSGQTEEQEQEETEEGEVGQKQTNNNSNNN